MIKKVAARPVTKTKGNLFLLGGILKDILSIYVKYIRVKIVFIRILYRLRD
jgi:hypothetical protein